MSTNTRPVRIGVIYPWDNTARPNLQDDELWQKYRTTLQAICNNAAAIVGQRLGAAPPHLVAEFRRVRATGGQPITQSIFAAIDRCDLIVAHLSTEKRTQVNPNVCFEIGYAMAKGMPVFLATTKLPDDGKCHCNRIPSDLAGIYLTTLEPKDAVGRDRSLYSALRGGVVEEFFRKKDQPAPRLASDVEAAETEPDQYVAQITEAKPNADTAARPVTAVAAGSP